MALIRLLSIFLGEIKGSARSGLESTHCSQKWHREYLVVIKELISGALHVLKENWTLMSTCEDLDDSSSDEDNEEEDNQYLMVDASTSKVEPALDASLDDEDP
ncbi:hypothetical protein JHK82_022553 [Glycine max]|nr:hypothetical protein JHK82_022553 [Glycine max]